MWSPDFDSPPRQRQQPATEGFGRTESGLNQFQQSIRLVVEEDPFSTYIDQSNGPVLRIELGPILTRPERIDHT